MVSVNERLKELDMELPEPPAPVAAYVPAVKAGDFIFISGQLPLAKGKLVYPGRVGDRVSLEDAQHAAKIAALNCLAVLGSMIDLDGDFQVVKLTGFVASGRDFFDQPKVVNGASQFLLYVLGDRGRHARAAVGVSALPLGAPVEIEMIVHTGGK
ncbi:MAG: RidA family protein [Pseudomonadota bacterium]